MLCSDFIFNCLKLCFGIFSYNSNFSNDQMATLNLFYFLYFCGVAIIFIYIVVTRKYSV